MPLCQRCRGIYVVRYHDELLCGQCFLLESRTLEPAPADPGDDALPQRAVALMNELIELLRTTGRPVTDAADLTATLLHHERPS